MTELLHPTERIIIAAQRAWNLRRGAGEYPDVDRTRELEIWECEQALKVAHMDNRRQIMSAVR